MIWPMIFWRASLFIVPIHWLWRYLIPIYQMGPKKDTKGGKGKAKDTADGDDKGKGGKGLKPATSLNVRHILVCSTFSFLSSILQCQAVWFLSRHHMNDVCIISCLLYGLYILHCWQRPINSLSQSWLKPRWSLLVRKTLEKGRSARKAS